MNVYSLRKAILTDMKRARAKHSPMSVADLIAISCESAIELAEPDEVAAQWDELTLAGYLEPIPGFGGKYLQIAEKGLRQLSIEFPQDAFIYGKKAV